jgi:hypothetical protein
MSLKNICAIPKHWTLEEYSRHTCADGSHSHLTRAQLHEKEKKGLVVYLRASKNRRETSIVYILDSHPGPSTASYSPGAPLNTGLSNRVGEVLAVAVYQRQPWGQVMLAHINGRRESPSGTI